MIKFLMIPLFLLCLLHTPIYAKSANGVVMQQERKEKIKDVFNRLRADNLEILNDFYHKELTFKDPLGEIKGLDSMKSYYAQMYKNVTDIKFDFKNLVAEGHNITGTWTMTLSAEGLNGGDPVIVDGVSHLTFDADSNLVIYHRDYFDMGAFVYEHIPVLGGIIRMVKGRLSHEE